jgi:hypothetical protein
VNLRQLKPPLHEASETRNYYFDGFLIPWGTVRTIQWVVGFYDGSTMTTPLRYAVLHNPLYCHQPFLLQLQVDCVGQMRIASIAFPFRPTFQRLELEKRWWHRLCVVIFFSLLLCTALFAVWGAYTVFAPQVPTMPDIQAGDIFDQVAAAKQQATHPPIYLDPATGERMTGTQPAIDYDALARKSGAISVQPMIDQQRNVHQIPMDKVIDALEAGDQRVVDMYDPKGNRGWIPEDKVQAALKMGFTIAKPVTLDLSKAHPLDKTIQMPDGSTSRFAPTVSDDAIKAQWSHAKIRQPLKAIMWAALITIAAALFISYLCQLAYRALLFVIFGNTVQIRS